MRKGVVLVVVIGIMLVVFTLALAALYTMTTESRIAEHKIMRTRAYYAIQAGTILGREMLRRDISFEEARLLSQDINRQQIPAEHFDANDLKPTKSCSAGGNKENIAKEVPINIAVAREYFIVSNTNAVELLYERPVRVKANSLQEQSIIRIAINFAA